MPKDVQIKVRHTNGVAGMPYTLILAHFVVMCHFHNPNCFILSHFELFGSKISFLQHESQKYRFFFKKKKKIRWDLEVEHLPNDFDHVQKKFEARSSLIESRFFV